MRLSESLSLRELDLFAGMAKPTAAELMRATLVQRFPAQAQLITEGQPADFLYVVASGTVELFAVKDGRETAIEIVRPPSTFALASVLRKSVYLMSARTVEDCEIIMLPAEKVAKAFERDQAFARAAALELAGRYRAIVKSMKDHKLRTAVERLANYLLRSEAEQGCKAEIQLQVDKRTLASLLGMTPENLSRALASLKVAGVEVKGRKIQLTSIDELRGLARPHPLIDDPAS